VKRSFFKALKIISIALLLLILLSTGATTYIIRQSWPQETGIVQLAGLKDRVEVARDKWGIPHIYANNQHDLFMAQGYIHAQDRFWQMDFWRHIGSGRLAEMFGQSQLETDRFLRTLGWARVAQQEIDQISPEMNDILQAYAGGVNAYLNERKGSALSLEYAVLKLLNPNYQPEPWKPLHSLTWGKAMAWDLGYNMEHEIERSVLRKTLSLTQVNELFPPYPKEHPVIVPQSNSTLSEVNEVEPVNDALIADISPALQLLNQPLEAMHRLLGPAGSGLGSNNWVISGHRTATSKPILANDPHLGVQMPSIWYEMGLHCTAKSLDCPYDVTGFSFAGMLGIIIGHNDRIAWGVTNVGPDVMDLYIEKVNPKNPNQYEVNGKWVDMQLLTETIQVAGGKPISQTVRYTRHGPVISDTYKPLKDFPTTGNINLPKNYAIALRWTALEPSNLLYAIPQINRAKNWQEFRTAVFNFDGPAQNFVYADIEGNIGYQMPGKIPIRNQGDGRYPVPGWTNEFEWKGYIPFEKLPSSFNPPQGYIATANNAVTGVNYPYLITKDWNYGQRAERIVEMIEGKKDPFTLADVQQMLGDSKSLNAMELVPILQQIDLKDQRLERARELLKSWDFQESMDEPAAALFEVFWKHLLAGTFHDNLPKNYWPHGGDRWIEVVKQLIKQPNSLWWDNKNTSSVETRDQIFRKAFTDAVDELESINKDPNRWRWGNLHTITFRNLTLGKSGISTLEALFNRGPFSSSGGTAIVNATQWDASTDSYQVIWLPSMRMIIDLKELDHSISINSTGQSGHAFHPHYDDMIDPWRKIEYHPMLLGKKVVKSNTSTNLTLKPPA
jgi:penicillin amidase